MKTFRVILLVVAVFVVLCLIAALAAYLLDSLQQRQAFDDRPLVLIHAPLNRDQVYMGEGILAHATARASGGVRRIELWVDGALVAAREAPDSGAVSPLVLTTGWQPEALGHHVFLVRAFSAAGVAGQASVAVEAVEAPAEGGQDLGGYIVQRDDETLEIIADRVGVEEEELEALNPDLGDDGPDGGDLVLYPDEEGGAPDGAPDGGEDRPGGPPPSESEPPAHDAPPPTPHDEPPGTEGGLFGFDLGIFELFALGSSAEMSVTLRLEVLALETGDVYESVHCYVSLAEGDPRWYPDEDFDQGTDESFTSLDGRSWDVATHFSGEQAPIIPWTEDEMLPIDVTCVGVVGGGTDAIPLGRVFITVRPEAWDGITRRAVSEDGEGTFTLDYRVSFETGAPGGYPVFLDPSMTPPVDLWLDPWRYSLRWEYYPRPDEEPIHGFRIYLNDTLQWVERPEARESGLPPEWFFPPCGETYRFTVTAFRYGFPDGPESVPSNEVTTFTGNPGDRGCERTVIVTLETLSTEYLERDMGAIYGSFYVNDQVLGIDGRCRGSGICGVVGLYADWEYDISSLTTNLGSGPARFLVDVQPGEQLVLGYDISAEGTGQVCAGETWYESDELDRVHSGGIVSERPSGYSSRCRVTYKIEPLGGGPVIEAGEEPPLPMLMVQDLTVDAATGQLQIHVRNVGAATWPAHNLDVAMFWPSGEGVGAYSWPDFFLPPGQVAILQYPEEIPGPPLGVCVLLDPGNEVPEEDDRSLGWTRGRYCRPLPDLIVTDATYDSDEERLLVRVENVGEGSLEHRDMNLRIDLADGRYFAPPAEWWADVSIAPRSAVLMEWPSIGPAQRALMLDGYTVVVDPGNDIAEESGFNNEYTVRGSTRLWLSWTWIDVPYDFRNMVEYSFEAYLVSGGSRRQVASWRIRQDIDWGSCFEPYHCVKHYDNEEYDTYWFEVAGDEELVVTIVVSHPGTLYSAVSLSEVYGPDEGWGAGPVGPRRTCGYLGGSPGPGRRTWVFDYHEGQPWDTTFHICREDAE